MINYPAEFRKMGYRLGFRVQAQGNSGYDTARQITNSRFDHKPWVVVFPKSAEHIAECLRLINMTRIPFRICSGGHHHEGMSSVDGGIVIRLSELNQITYPDFDRSTAWIPVGKPLDEVYDELQYLGKFIPGGVCESVNVGGLVQGGGWGNYARLKGLACDSVLRAEVVLSNGNIVQADREQDSELFRAVRGGGGGNWGVVTRFLFQLHDLPPNSINFSIKSYNMETGERLLQKYLEIQSGFPNTITSVAAISVKTGEEAYVPVKIVGTFSGEDKAKMQEYLEPLRKVVENDKPPGGKTANSPGEQVSWEDITPSISPEQSQFSSAETPDAFSDQVEAFSPTPESFPAQDTGFTALFESFNLKVKQGEDTGTFSRQASQLSAWYQPAPTSHYPIRGKEPHGLCLRPFHHKISSAFPKSQEAYPELARKLIKTIEKENVNKHLGVRLFVTLHGIGGAVGDKDKCATGFAFRDKDFIIQIHAWWADRNFATEDTDAEKEYENDSKKFLAWVKNTRQNIEPEIEGAFINFADRDIPIEAYYGSNFGWLRKAKTQYDPGKYMKFPMGIPHL